MRNHQILGFAGALAVSALAACEDKSIGDTPRTGTVDDIKETPLKYAGRTVTVSGEVDRVFGEQGFEIEGDGIVWEKKLLVVTKSPVQFGPAALRHDDDVVVHGTIKRMARADLERELGHTLSPELEEKYRDQPVLVADSVRLVETGFRWSEDMREGTIVSALRLLSAITPKSLAGTNIDLDDVQVLSKSGRGIWIGPNTRSQLFVVPNDASTLANIKVGDHVDLEGKIREMPPLADAVKKFELDPVTIARATDETVYIEATELAKAAVPPAS